MIKSEYEEMIFNSDLSQSAKLVLLAYLHHNKQQELKEVWPSYTTVAKCAGLGRETARKYAEELAEAGWLIKGSLRKGNVQAYGFGEVVETTDNLKKKKRKMVVESIDNLNRSGKRQVVESNSQVVERVTARLSNESVQVVETGSTRKEEKNNLENKELEKMGATSAPVLPDLPLASYSDDSSLLQDTQPVPGDLEEDDVDAVLLEDLDFGPPERAGEESLEASESFQASKDPSEPTEAGRENPRPLPEGLRHLVERFCSMSKGYDPDLTYAKAVELWEAGYKKSPDDLVIDAKTSPPWEEEAW